MIAPLDWDHMIIAQKQQMTDKKNNKLLEEVIRAGQLEAILLYRSRDMAVKTRVPHKSLWH